MEYSVISILIGIILAFVGGANLTWTSPEIPYLNSTDTGPFDRTLTADEASWIGGVLSLGAILGPFIFGYLADKIGRKYTILATAVPFAISSLLSAFAKVVSEFYIARFITGLGIGSVFTILPMYIGEVSRNEHRGVLGSVQDVFICLGLIFTYVAGSFIESVMAFNLVLAGLTVAFFVLFLLLGCESPHWYVAKNKHDLAKQVLLKIRNGNNDVVEKELEYIKDLVEGGSQGSIIDIFKSKGNTKAFIIGSGLIVFQQTTGINAVLFFAQSIFDSAGTSIPSRYCSMMIGSVQFATSFITPSVSNRFGRKVLLVFSGIGIFIFEVSLGIYEIIDKNDHDRVSSLNFLPIVFLVFFIATYNVGFGPLPWAIIGEIFPTNIRSSASALVTSVCWLTSFLITNWFSQLVAVFGLGVCFIGFGVATLIATLFSQFYVLETKGKSLAQIQEALNK